MNQALALEYAWKSAMCGLRCVVVVVNCSRSGDGVGRESLVGVKVLRVPAFGFGAWANRVAWNRFLHDIVSSLATTACSSSIVGCMYSRDKHISLTAAMSTVIRKVSCLLLSSKNCATCYLPPITATSLQLSERDASSSSLTSLRLISSHPMHSHITESQASLHHTAHAIYLTPDCHVHTKSSPSSLSNSPLLIAQHQPPAPPRQTPTCDCLLQLHPCNEAANRFARSRSATCLCSTSPCPSYKPLPARSP